MHYAVLSSSLNLSANIAINSEFVGFPFEADTVYPNMLSTVSVWPLPHATSIAWRIARSTLDGVVLYLCKILEFVFLLNSHSLYWFLLK